MPSSCLGVGCCVGSYTRCCRHVKESHRKTTKLAGSTRRHDFPIPIDFPTACIPVVLSYLFAYSHNLTHSCISSHPILPYCPQAPKNPTSNQARPASGLSRSTHPTRLLKYPGGHGYGIAWRRGVNVDCGVDDDDDRGDAACLCDRAIGPEGRPA